MQISLTLLFVVTHTIVNVQYYAGKVLCLSIEYHKVKQAITKI